MRADLAEARARLGERGEKLGALQSRADALADGAAEFHELARKLNRG